jgi:hypothetical protein
MYFHSCEDTDNRIHGQAISTPLAEMETVKTIDNVVLSFAGTVVSARR